MFWNESSYLKSPIGTKVPGNKDSWERKLQGTKVPRNGSSTYGTFIPGNESSLVRMFQLPLLKQHNQLITEGYIHGWIKPHTSSRQRHKT